MIPCKLIPINYFLPKVEKQEFEKSLTDSREYFEVNLESNW